MRNVTVSERQGCTRAWTNYY